MAESMGTLEYDVRSNLRYVDSDIQELTRKWQAKEVLIKLKFDAADFEKQFAEMERKISAKAFKLNFDFSDVDRKVAALESRLNRLGLSGGTSAAGGGVVGGRGGVIAGTSNGDVSVSNPSSVAGTMREMANKPASFPQFFGGGGVTAASPQSDRISASLSGITTAGGGTASSGRAKAGELPPLPAALQSALKNEVMRTVSQGPMASQLANQLGVPLDDLQAAMQGNPTPTQLIKKMVGEHQAFQAARNRKHENIMNELEDAATKQRLRGLDAEPSARPQFPSWTNSGRRPAVNDSPSGVTVNPYSTGHVPTPNYDDMQRHFRDADTRGGRGSVRERPYSPIRASAPRVPTLMDLQNAAQEASPEEFAAWADSMGGGGSTGKKSGHGHGTGGVFPHTPRGMFSRAAGSVVSKLRGMGAGVVGSVAAGVVLAHTAAEAQMMTVRGNDEIALGAVGNRTEFDVEETRIRRSENEWGKNFQRSFPILGRFYHDSESAQRRIANEESRQQVVLGGEVNQYRTQTKMAQMSATVAGRFGNVAQEYAAMSMSHAAQTLPLTHEMLQIANEQGWIQGYDPKLLQFNDYGVVQATAASNKVSPGKRAAAQKFLEVEKQRSAHNDAFASNQKLFWTNHELSNIQKEGQEAALRMEAEGAGSLSGLVSANSDLKRISGMEWYPGKAYDVGVADARVAAEKRGVAFRRTQNRLGAAAAGQLLSGDHLGAQITGIYAEEADALDGADPDSRADISARFGAQRQLARRQYNLGISQLGFANAGAQMQLQNNPYLSQLAGLMSSREQALYQKDPTQQKLINEQYDLQEQLLSKGEGKRRALFGVGTSAIDSSSKAQQLRNVHQYAAAAAEDIVGSTAAAIGSLDEPDEKLRRARVASLRGMGKAQLEGLRTQLRDEMAGATAQGMSAYITRGEQRSRPEAEALRDKQAMLRGGIDDAIKRLDAQTNNLQDARFTDPDGKKRIEAIVETAKKFGAVSESDTAGKTGGDGKGSESSKGTATTKVEGVDQVVKLLGSIDGKLNNVGKAN